MHINDHIFGGVAALISAAAWAYGPILFRGLSGRFTPASLNLARCVLGALLLSAVMLFFGVQPLSARSVLFLVLSGVFGIALGDTFFFKGLFHIGPRMAVVMETLCPAVTVILAVIFLGERPTIQAWTGILLIISGVSWVIWEKGPKELLKENWAKGVKFGVLSVFFTSIGIILTKIGVTSSGPVTSTVIRLISGGTVLFIFAILRQEPLGWIAPFREGRVCLRFFSAVMIGTCIGLLFSVIALKYTAASLAVPLNSTSPIFVIPMAYLVFGERISQRSMVGAFMTVAGVTLVLLFS